MKYSRGIRNIPAKNCLQKTFVIIIFFWGTITQHALAQFTDNFADGNFSANPVWTGSTTDFTINASQQLQLNNTIAATSTLTTSFSALELGITEWNFFIKMTLAPSTTNFTKVYLVSDQQNLSSSLNGYYLQFGEANANDAIELFKQTGTTSVSVCRGTNATIATTVNVRVKVTRSATGLWTLFTDYTGGTNYVQENSGTDNTFTSSSWFGIRCTYTSTNANRFFFDDFNLTMQAAPDVTPPTVSSVDLISSTVVDVNFSEVIDNTTSQDNSNYSIAGNISPLISVIQANSKTVRLTFGQPFTNGVTQTLTILNVKDVALNSMSATTKTFLFFQPVSSALKDIVINELLPDQTPVIGMPEAEFVELYNRSANPFDLSGWTLTDGTTIGTLGTRILLPGEYLILSSSSSSTLFQSFGNRMGLTNWPSLNNSGDMIKLKNPDGTTIDSVGYSLSWYQSDEKKDGGYSLELIDPENFCKGSANWKASENLIGGTPGSQNSIFNVVPDLTAPRLLSASAVSANEIEIVFDESLSKNSNDANAFAVTSTSGIGKILFSNLERSKIKIQFATELDPFASYKVTNVSAHDCAGNIIDPNFTSVNFKLDEVKPEVLSVDVVNSMFLLITFSEKISTASAQNFSHYQIENYSGIATLQADLKSVSLSLDQPLVNGELKTIAFSEIVDLAGNFISPVSKTFLYFEKKPSHHRDIIITEIFADPTPTDGLPEAEFLEIYNRSADPFNLKDWKLSDATSKVALPDYILLPNEYLILTSTTKVSSFSTFGKTLGIVSFPSLNNTGESIILRDENDIIIDSVFYSDKWYGSTEKKDGGYSLERIDTENFCRSGKNWIASSDSIGGTPGKQNSVYNITPDTFGPRLTSVTILDAGHIQLNFDESLSLSALNLQEIETSPLVVWDSIKFMNSEMEKLILASNVPLDSSTSFVIKTNLIHDCSGNIIDLANASAGFMMDEIKPTLVALEVVDSRRLALLFSEKLAIEGSKNLVNYLVNEHTTPLQVLANEDQKSVVLVFENSFQNGVVNNFQVSGITDRAGNLIAKLEKTFLFFEPFPVSKKDVIITEIFADPTPTLGLPETEFIEIYNRSNNPVNLFNWKFSDATTTTTFPSYILLPKRYLLLTGSTKVSTFSVFGTTIGLTSFPSLANTGEPLVIKNDLGSTVDSVNYSIAYYHDEEKKDGGWTLELVDTENTCAEISNWTSSEDLSGGTPGKLNSVAANKPDLTGPKIISVFAKSPHELLAVFDEKLENALPSLQDINTKPPLSFEQIRFADQSLTSLIIKSQSEILPGQRYSITFDKLSDCAGNAIQQEFRETFFALPEKSDAFDIVINEILFNPNTTGVDFVELYNRSSKYINLKYWQIANGSDDKENLSTTDVLFSPGEYLAWTKDAAVLKSEYLHSREENFLEVDLPSFNDDEGLVYLIADDNTLIDSLSYKESMHSPFLADKEGVSLERISFDSFEEDVKSNWKSASEASGFATPGYKNSNAFDRAFVPDAIQVSPEAFDPTNGQPSFTEINYKFDQPGFIASVRILDNIGRRVREITSNELLGAEGFFRWDGDMDNGTRARIGAYMVWFEVFNERGELLTFRKRVIVASRK